MSLSVTLDDIESRLAAVSDQDEATANISTADYSLRRMYINMAQREWAETGGDVIGDDTSPALTLRNTTGPGAEIRGLVTSSTASIDVIDAPILTRGAANSGVLVRNTILGSASVGILRIQGTSIASGAVLEFTGKGAFASITSVVLTTVANSDYAIRVQVGLVTRWIPLFKDAALVGTAAVE